MSFSRKHNPVTQNSPQTYYFPSAELDTCLFFNIMELNGTRIVLLKAWKMKKLQNKNEKLSCNVSKVPGIKKQKSTNLVLFGFMYVSTDLHPPSRLNLPSTCNERVVHVRDRI